MAERRSRYRKMERYMTYALLVGAALFVIYLFAAGFGVLWLKVITAILAILAGSLCLVYLYLTKELLQHRSLWMTAAAGAIVLCVVFSLILNFPSPAPVMPVI